MRSVDQAGSVVDIHRSRSARISALVGLLLAVACLLIPGIALAASSLAPAVATTPTVVQPASVVPTGSLTGVVSVSGGRALSGVSVSVAAGPRTTTAADGSYSIRGVGEGTRTVTFARTGYVSQSPQALITAGATTTLNVVLASVPTTGTLRGKVTVAGGGALSGVRVAISGGASTKTASNGTYSIRNLAPGTRTVKFSKTGFVSKSPSTRISAGATTTLNAALIQCGNLAGRVKCGTSRAPLSGVKVQLSAAASRIIATAKTWLGVRYVWGGTSRSGVDCSGLTQAIARDVGYSSFPRTAASQWSYFKQQGWTVSRPRPGDFVYFRSPYSPSGHHTALYVDTGMILEAPGSGDHVKIARMPSLHVLGYGRLKGGVSATTTADGSYSLRSLEPGTYSVTIATRGYVGQSPEAVVLSAKTTTLSATLVKDGVLSGSVTATGNVALSGVTVTVKGERSTKTAATGRYKIALLEPGTYTATFALPGYVSISRRVVISAGATTTANAGLVRPLRISVATITRLAGPAGVKVKRLLKLIGTVSRSDAPGKVTVVRSRLVRGKWTVAGSTRLVLRRGKFSYAFKPTGKGSWRFVATYSGAVVKNSPYKYTTYKSSKSAIKNVKVK